MNRGQSILLLGLIVSVIFSAIAVAYTKYTSRQLFVDSQMLDRERDELDIVWGKLQLEYGTWGAPGRVENLAHEKLRMRLPQSAEVVVIGRGYGG